MDEATAPIARSGRARRRVTHPIQALLRPPLQPRIEWPSIEQEMKDYLPLFTGEVLNAGAGRRDLQPWIPGRLTNQDLPGVGGDLHIASPLHEIPRPNGSFDVIICNAVLEHVRNPHEVMREFNRVLKIGGHLYLSVPFMQPEHRCPTDFQRYTRDGLGELCERFGFTVEKIEGVHSVYHTLGWIVHCWLAQPTWRHLALRTIFTPALRLAQRLRSRSYVDSIASGYRAWARKERSL